MKNALAVGDHNHSALSSFLFIALNSFVSFKEYLKDYDLENGSIKLKIKHTYEVVNKSEYIAKGLELDKENIELAKVIALLHDIGRFE